MHWLLWVFSLSKATIFLGRMRSSLVGMRSSLSRMRSSLARMRSSLARMRSSLVVRAPDSQCTSCNGPEFDHSIRRHSRIWGAVDEAVLNIVWKKNPPKKYLKKIKNKIFLGWGGPARRSTSSNTCQQGGAVLYCHDKLHFSIILFLFFFMFKTLFMQDWWNFLPPGAGV